MVRERSRYLKGNASRDMWKRFLYALLLLLWGFSFFSTSFASPLDNQSDNSTHIENLSNQRITKVDASNHNPIAFDFPELQSEGSYESDEKEIEHHVDDDGKVILKTFAVHQSVVEKTASITVILPNPHRRLVALFVLFHSWKSHLS